jgi:hypothetical protein
MIASNFIGPSMKYFQVNVDISIGNYDAIIGKHHNDQSIADYDAIIGKHHNDHEVLPS